MIDFSVYEFLSKIIDDNSLDIRAIIKQCNCESCSVGVNTVQSLMRRSVMDTVDSNELYAVITKKGDSYVSTKVGNLHISLKKILQIVLGVKKLEMSERVSLLSTAVFLIGFMEDIRYEFPLIEGCIIDCMNSHICDMPNRGISCSKLQEYLEREYCEILKKVDYDNNAFDNAIEHMKKIGTINEKKESLYIAESVII